MDDLLGSLRADVETLAWPGERVAGGDGHRAARVWLLSRCEGLGLEPYHGSFEWPYEHGRHKFVNVLARLPGSDLELDPVLLAAHYDTCGPQPGADDNAAAIAILLASVVPLRESQLERDVIFAFFDAEEPPYFLSPEMGSTHFYHYQRREEIQCAVVLDLCGHDVPIPGREDLLFITGMESAPRLEEIVRSGNDLPGLRTVATLNRYIGDLSDHHAFRLDGRPFLFLSCGRWDHYHASTDTPDRLNYVKMAAIRDYVVHVATGVALRPLGQADSGYDTTATEIALIEQHLGPLLATLELQVRTRADVDRVIQGALELFGL